MRKVMKWIVNITLVIAVLTVLSFFVAPRFLHLDFFTIQSGSMRPTLPVGSVVVTQPVDAGQIEAGDIIAFNAGPSESSVVVHRVVEVVDSNGAPAFRTRGDANAAPDGNTVEPENVIGRVFFSLPLLGYFSAFIKTKIGFIVTVALPGLIIVSLEVWNIVNAVADRSKKRPAVQTVGVPTGPSGELPQDSVPGRQSPPTQAHRQPATPARPVATPAPSYVACKSVTPPVTSTSAQDPSIEAEAARIIARLKAQTRTSVPPKE